MRTGSKAVFLVFALAFSIASAQTQRLPGVVDKPMQEIDIPPARSLEAPRQAPIEPVPQKKKASRNKIIPVLNSVVFTGNTILKDSYLQNIVKKYIGSQFTDADLASLKYEVKKAYYDKGYILVRIITPPQDIKNGVLNVSIYEAKVDTVTIDTGDTIYPGLTNGISHRMQPGQVIKEKTAESLVNDFKDLHGVDASLVLSPGSKLATTNLGIALVPAKENRNSVSVNNYGSQLTGRNVASAHVERGNLFKMGEKLDLDVQVSQDNLWNIGAGLETPIGIRNIFLETRYLHAENEIGGRLEDLKARGETDMGNIALSSNLVNTRKNVTKLSVGAEGRTHKSFIFDEEDTRDNLRKLYTEISTLFKGITSVIYTSAKVSKGLDVLGATQMGDLSATRLEGNQEAWIFNPVALGLFRPFSDNGTFKIFTRGQMASDKLLSSDLFTTGGYGNVRGFDVASEAAEAGYTISLQYDHVLPVNYQDFTFKAGPFIDGGAVYSRIEDTVQDSHLYSAGLGFEASTKLVPAGETTLRMDWAHPIGSYNSNTISDDTFYFNLKQEF